MERTPPNHTAMFHVLLSLWKVYVLLLYYFSLCLLQVIHLLLPVTNAESRDQPLQQLLEVTG